MRAATVRNLIRNPRKDSVGKFLAVLVGFAVVLVLSLSISFVGFYFVDKVTVFGASLNDKILSLLFFSVLFLVALSTLIVSYSTLFLVRETGFFFQHPVTPGTILLVKLTEAVLFSSWATLFLCFPMIVAFGWVRDASPMFYLQAGLVLVVFLLFSSLTGSLIAITVAPVIRRLGKRQLLFAGALFLGGLLWAFISFVEFGSMNGSNDLQMLDRFHAQLALLQSPYFPGYWATEAVLAACAGNHRDWFFHGGTLLANMLILLPCFGLYGERFYGAEWLRSRESTVRRLRRRRAGKTRREGRRFSPTPTRALALKDLRVFVRDPAQLSQSLLFGALMAIYCLSLLDMPSLFTSGSFRLLVYLTNLAAVCLLLSAFTSRFLFPLMSLEGKAIWIVGLAPVTRLRLLYHKATFGLVVTLSLGVLAALFSNLALGYRPGLVLSATYTTVLAGVCLTALAIGLGAAYPNFTEDNPARIVAGFGGALNFFASALAVIGLVAIEALPYLLVGSYPPTLGVAVVHLLALAYTAAVSTLAMRLGSRAFEGREF